MAHEHNHKGHHHHHGPVEITGINKAFVIGIVLNLVYVLIQVVIGFRINSLSLLSDAGHNFLDVAGLALAMLAFRLSKSRATEKYTYGYRKASILISLLNAVVLLVSIGAIAYEATLRFKYPQVLPGKTIALIAAIGILINGISAFMFFKDRKHDINVKSAFLHLLSDAVVSLGLVVGGILIYYTRLYWIDPLLSIIICLVIIASTWGLLRDSLRLSLDGVPGSVNMQQVRTAIMSTAGILDVHHLHIWAISTTQNALTGHLVVAKDTPNEAVNNIKNEVRHTLEHMNISHITLETEFNTDQCIAHRC